jgi:hypothetical protein
LQSVVSRVERGDAAAHAGALLVIEVKSTVPDVQGTLSGIDRTSRLAWRIATERGWKVRSVSRWLVLPDDRTSRRRVSTHGATFETALPARTLDLRRWAHQPAGAIAGILFVPEGSSRAAGHRMVRSGGTAMSP